MLHNLQASLVCHLATKVPQKLCENNVPVKITKRDHCSGLTYRLYAPCSADEDLLEFISISTTKPLIITPNCLRLKDENE